MLTCLVFCGGSFEYFFKKSKKLLYYITQSWTWNSCCSIIAAAFSVFMTAISYLRRWVNKSYFSLYCLILFNCVYTIMNLIAIKLPVSLGFFNICCAYWCDASSWEYCKWSHVCLIFRNGLTLFMSCWIRGRNTVWEGYISHSEPVSFSAASWLPF